MITNHKQTCVIHFVDCWKALHSYLTHHTRKHFDCERRRGLHGGRHVVARVDVLGTTCTAGRPLGLASEKLPSAAHRELWERPVLPGGETGLGCPVFCVAAVIGVVGRRGRGEGGKGRGERWGGGGGVASKRHLSSSIYVLWNFHLQVTCTSFEQCWILRALGFFSSCVFFDYQLMVVQISNDSCNGSG